MVSETDSDSKCNLPFHFMKMNQFFPLRFKNLLLMKIIGYRQAWYIENI